MKRVRLNRQMLGIMKKQLRSFRKKFGREPGPGDPVFFDPDAESPVPISEVKFETEVIKAARKAGFSEEQINRVCLQFEIDYSKYRSDA